MRKAVLSLCLLFFVTGMFAQTKVNERAVQEATDEMVALYQLNDSQTKTMYTIQERRFRNMSEIEHLKGQNQVTYLQKLKSIRTGTEGSIKRMLTEPQMKIFNEQALERRKKESEVIKRMKQQGASKEAIQLALLEIE